MRDDFTIPPLSSYRYQQSLKEGSWISLSKDWEGQSLKAPAVFRVRSTEKALFFEVCFPSEARSKPGSSYGSFEEELWEYDVAELFITTSSRGSSQYLEMNIAPNGAWWACWFNGVRALSEQKVEQEAFSVCQEVFGKGAGLSFSVEWASLVKVLGPLVDLRYNVTWILESPESRYLSLAEIPKEKPDFHQPDSFLPLVRE